MHKFQGCAKDDNFKEWLRKTCFYKHAKDYTPFSFAQNDEIVNICMLFFVQTVMCAAIHLFRALLHKCSVFIYPKMAIC